jgi:hypothetical protein
VDVEMLNDRHGSQAQEGCHHRSCYHRLVGGPPLAFAYDPAGGHASRYGKNQIPGRLLHQIIRDGAMPRQIVDGIEESTVRDIQYPCGAPNWSMRLRLCRDIG